jgi:TatD DNase family protein
MGPDFHYDMSPRDEQRACFRAQIKLALAVNKPIVIHDRESNDETFDILVEEGAFAGTVLFHCFTGTVPAMQAIVAHGGFISIPGIVTFKNADVMRDVTRACPADRLLVETDSPFLTPIPHRGKKNEPAYVALVAAKVAELRGVFLGDLVASTAANTTRVFGL